MVLAIDVLNFRRVTSHVTLRCYTVVGLMTGVWISFNIFGSGSIKVKKL